MATCSVPAKEAEGMNTKVPNWLELPIEITTNILQRLDTIEIVTSARKVCQQWGNICKDPLMWRTIRMRYNNTSPYIINHVDLVKICRFAVKQSRGHLENIDIEYFCTDDLLEYIAENASSVRCMRLSNCLKISESSFKYLVRRLQNLEEMDISFCNIWKDSLAVLGKSSPLLKSFKFELMHYSGYSDEEAFVIAETMQGLCHLDIQGHILTNTGLIAILNACPFLESLNVDRCFNLNLTGSLGQRCREQFKTLWLPKWFHDVEDLFDEDSLGDYYDSQFFAYHDA